MKHFRFFLIAGLIASIHVALAQQTARFSEDRTKFIVDLKKVMETSQNSDAVRIGQTFEGMWNASSLTDKQRMQLYNIVIAMQKKRYRVNPNYMGYFSLLSNAVQGKGMSGMKLDSLIYVTSQVLENSSAAQFQKYLDFLNLFFEKGRFYSSNYNRLYVQAPTFSIWYIDPKSVNNSETVIEPEVSVVEKVQDENADWGTSFSEETKTPASTTLEQIIDEEAPPSVELPALSGPILRISNATFTMACKFDSVSFGNVKGSAMPLNNLFLGEKATFDWSYAGLNGQEVFAELDKFSMNVSKLELYAENANLTYKGKLEKPIGGSFAFKALNKIDKSKTTYPSFASYSSKINLGNIGDGLSLSGGFSLNGKTINSLSAGMGISTLSYSVGNVMKFKAVSKGFEITDSAVSSRQAAVYIPFGKDSIFHFGAKLHFHKRKNILKLTQVAGNFKNASYYNTYHKLEIQAEAASYDIAKSRIEFYVVNARNQIPVKLVSYENFDESKYDLMKGMFPFHPLQAAIGYARGIKNNKFFSDDLASAEKLNPPTVRAAMASLAQDGFADYNPTTAYVILTKKAWHYYLAKANKKDYDDIQIQCLSPIKPNVVLDMTTKKMQCNGAKPAYFCRPLNVYFEVDSTGEISFEKNRKMTFNGMLSAGHFQFIGRNFTFDYDSFMVRMDKVDVVNINIVKEATNALNTKEGQKRARLGIELEKSVGYVYISKPNNKSGKRQMPEYPIFKADKGGIVYFDKKEILNGAYDRKISFNIPPFTVDSLNGQDGKSIAFDGTFVSNNIFPDFKEKLRLQRDLSLGFEHQTPKEGYPVYGNKGRYFEQITLNNLGIRGSGKLETMNSTILSEDLIFYPDSLISLGSSAKVKKIATAEIHHPDIDIEEHEMKWYPKKDTLIFKTFNKAFSMYANTVEFSGKVGLTSKSAFADGKLITRGSEITSNQYLLKEEGFTGHNSKFIITSDDSAKPNMAASHAKIEFDLKTNKAVISPEVEGFVSDTFPYIQYSTSINRCEWDLEKQTLTMGNKKDLKSVKGVFYSLNPVADSLSFSAAYAFYDIKKQYMHVKGVPFVRSADSEILPDSGLLTIDETGKIETLQNAGVRMDSSNKYHLLTKGTIDILSRQEFRGDGYYKFPSSEKEEHELKVVEFQFQDVQENKTSKKRRKNQGTIRRMTIAKMDVPEEENLHISQGILYKGDMELHSNKKNPVVSGFVKLDLKRNNNMGSWIPYQRLEDSSSVVLKISNTKNDQGGAITTGIHLSVDGSKLYSTFISQKENDADKDIFNVSGNLKFDPSKGQYTVAEPTKLQNNLIEGNSVSLNDITSSIYYEGKANLIQPVPDFEVLTSAVGKGSLDSANFFFDSFITIPMSKVNPAALNSMASNIIAYATQNNLPYANDFTDLLRLKLLNIIGQKAFDNYERLLENGIPKSLNNIGKLTGSLVFSNVNLVWAAEHAAFRSKGPIGISHALKKEVNAFVEGYVEIKRSANGDAFRILLTPNADKWYYISYDNYRMALCSNDEEFTKSVLAKSKGETAGRFSCVPADPHEKVQFNKEFNLNYLGKEIFDEYVPAEGTTPIESMPAEEIMSSPDELPVTAPAVEPVKESKKKKKKAEAEPLLETAPAQEANPAEQAAPAEAAPAEETPEPVKESKKKKKKAEAEPVQEAAPSQEASPAEQAAPAETAPAEETPNEDDTGKKKKKKSKKDQAAPENIEEGSGF